MDLISRQAAIDEITEYGSGDSVYMSVGELKRRIEQLPSAQPETRCVAEVKIDGEELQECVDKAVRQIAENMPEQRWIPVTKKAHPDLPIRVQVQMDNGWIITAYYQEGEWLSVPDCGEPLKDKWIEAWRELPEPYAERRE